MRARTLEVVSKNLEHLAEDTEYLRRACEVFGWDKFADQLASHAKELRQNAAALQAQAKPRRVRAPKLVVNNA